MTGDKEKVWLGFMYIWCMEMKKSIHTNFIIRKQIKKVIHWSSIIFILRWYDGYLLCSPKKWYEIMEYGSTLDSLQLRNSTQQIPKILFLFYFFSNFTWRTKLPWKWKIINYGKGSLDNSPRKLMNFMTTVESRVGNNCMYLILLRIGIL